MAQRLRASVLTFQRDRVEEVDRDIVTSSKLKISVGARGLGID